MNRLTIWTLVLVNIAIWAFSTWLSNEHHKENLALQERQAHTIRLILDMQMRTFHYVRPHKDGVEFCPECNGDSFSDMTMEEIYEEYDRRQARYEVMLRQTIKDHEDMKDLSEEERKRIQDFRKKDANNKWQKHKGK